MSRTGRLVVLGIAGLVCAACDQRPRGLLSAALPQDVSEGQHAEVTITIKNPFSEPLIPLALCLYVRADPTEYLVHRQTIGEVEYCKPLLATEVRHLQTLDRIEADHVRDEDQWRHVPDSRFLHPRILLPGQSVSETFSLQAMQSHRRLLYCDLYYLVWGSDRVRGRLFVRTKPDAVPPDAVRYTEVFTRIDESRFDDPDPKPERYLLYRPARIHDRTPMMVSQEVRLEVRPQQFTYRQAARRARLGARTTAYFTAANAWAFEYADGGTWFVSPDAVVKLKGRYADMIADLERNKSAALTFTIPRKPDDKLLAHLEKAGYVAPGAEGTDAEVSIPCAQLLTFLEQSEALGYTIKPTAGAPNTR